MPEDQEAFEAAWAEIVEDLTRPEESDGSPPAAAVADVPPDPAPRPPDDFVDTWADEGHFIPPEPPEIPAGTPLKRLAWAAALGGPTILMLSTVTPWDPAGFVTVGAGLACLAGFITLVWHLPESREDGWDDGARL